MPYRLRLSVKSFDSADVADIEELMEAAEVDETGLPDRFELTITIGEADSFAGDNFSRLVDRSPQKRSKATDKVLHVPYGDFRHIKQRVEQLVHASERASWEECVKALRVHFHWEYG